MEPVPTEKPFEPSSSVRENEKPIYPSDTGDSRNNIHGEAQASGSALSQRNEPSENQASAPAQELPDTLININNAVPEPHVTDSAKPPTPASLQRPSAEEPTADLEAVQCQVKLQSRTIGELTEKIVHVQTTVCNNDDALNQVLGDLTTATKNLAHNQSVLENRLEDLLRNQVNTDSTVNNLLDKLDQVSQFLNKAVKTNSLLAPTPPQQGHRGPGRPPKTRNALASAAAALSMTNKDTLPDGSVGIPRSKKLFQDSDQSSNSADSSNAGSLKSGGRNPPSSAPDQDQAPPVKKRGPGRPPKRKHHWAEKRREALAQSEEANRKGAEQENGAQAEGQAEGQAEDHRETPAEEQGGEQDIEQDEENGDGGNESDFAAYEEPKIEDEDLPATPSDDGTQVDSSSVRADDPFYEPRAHRGRGRPSTKSASDKPAPLTQAQIKRQQELERRRDSREQMLVSMKYSDRNKAKLFMESNRDLLRAMREEERKKRMTAFSYESPGHSTGPTPNTTNGNTPSPVPVSTSSSRRPSHYMPTSHGDSVPSEHESILREEYHRPSSGQFTESNDANPEDSEVRTPHSETTTEATEEPSLALMTNSSGYNTPAPAIVPRKVGILSMLNEDEDESSGSQKRKLPELYPDFPNKKDKLDDESKRDFRSMIPMLPEKKDNRGRPANSSSSGDNSTALLLASPVELICRDGFFYRKADAEVPITTGTYLEFKFKSKEDDLIRLTMSQEDYAELTKQDRINAYFLKPEIKAETEFASAVLSKIVLTEKYVNSLEYFLMEFRWENRLVGLGLKLRESKRTWQRRKALFALFEFWRDKSREKRGFPEFTMMHAVKEMENYRIFINRSVSWFYNHITLLKMILFDLCDNTDTQWREWMFPRGQPLPVAEEGSASEDTLNEAIDEVLTLDFLEDGTENRDTRPSTVASLPDSQHEN